MEARSSSGKQGGRTFIESARRAQIVDAAIEVIADQGYAHASFAKIAKQAGLSSTGMISYHFRGKDDLIREVVIEIMRVSGEFMVAKIDAETDPVARLRAFITSNLALVDEYPKHIRALLGIVAGVQQDDPELRGIAPFMAQLNQQQVERIRAGQQAGRFRDDFDPVVMVLALRGAMDAAVTRATFDAGFDTAAAARELADIFDRATRRD